MGAWIETWQYLTLVDDFEVAPHVGAWIETSNIGYLLTILKVAPHVGAWIETIKDLQSPIRQTRRTPCGCVD